MSDQKSHLIRELFMLNKRDLLKYFTRRVGREDASDLLQETFVRALRRSSNAGAIDDPPAFLQVIAANLTRDFTRRRKTEAKYLEFGDLPEVPSSEAPPGAQIERSEKSRLLRAAVESLPPRSREVFVLVMHENLPLKTAAKRLGISDSMARRHLRLAFQRCRAALG